jgi:hypothetical protein
VRNAGGGELCRRTFARGVHPRFLSTKLGEFPLLGLWWRGGSSDCNKTDILLRWGGFLAFKSLILRCGMRGDPISNVALQWFLAHFTGLSATSPESPVLALFGKLPAGRWRKSYRLPTLLCRLAAGGAKIKGLISLAAARAGPVQHPHMGAMGGTLKTWSVN